MNGYSHKAWLVDLDGTLYRPRPVKLAMAVELLLGGLGDLSAIRAFREEHEAMRMEGGCFEPSPYRVQLERAASKLARSSEQLEPVVVRWMQSKPCKWLSWFARKELLDELRTFREGGGKTAIVSDYPGSKKLAALGVSSDFDATICNGEPGGPSTLKPSPEGYLLAAARLECDPSECLVIGDREDADGEAARAGGMSFRKV